MRAKLFLRFWEACVFSTAHIINKMPLDILQFRTPFEQLNGKSPSYNKLKMIRSLGYNLGTCLNDKCALEAKRQTVTGDLLHQKAYQLHDLDKHITFISCDVKFYENICPFKMGQVTLVSTFILVTTIFFPYHLHYSLKHLKHSLT